MKLWRRARARCIIINTSSCIVIVFRVISCDDPQQDQEQLARCRSNEQSVFKTQNANSLSNQRARLKSERETTATDRSAANGWLAAERLTGTSRVCLERERVVAKAVGSMVKYGYGPRWLDLV